MHKHVVHRWLEAKRPQMLSHKEAYKIIYPLLTHPSKCFHYYVKCIPSMVSGQTPVFSASNFTSSVIILFTHQRGECKTVLTASLFNSALRTLSLFPPINKTL